MKLSSKWLLWFGGIGIYVMFLGGVFYYNLFKWTFDEKLKQDILEMIKVHTPTLRKGLLRSPRAITLDEYDIMSSLSKDERISTILYLNKAGIVRWHKESRLMGISWDEYQKDIGTLTDAVAQAYLSKSPKVRLVPKQPFYEIAIPLSVRGDIIGIVNIQVSRAGSEAIIYSAMRKYVFGAIGVLLLLGIPLYIFLHHFVVYPLSSLKDSIDTISTKSFDVRFAPRKDEIGDLTESLGQFLQKVRGELDSMSAREKQRSDAEQHWWRSILNTIMPSGHHAIVVDEDNNVLYTNFELFRSDESGKLHLLDVVDSQQQNLLRLIGVALETPNQVVEGDTAFKGENCHVKVLHLAEAGDIRRTLILFESKVNVSL